jgi:hypothetical protein
MTPKMPAGLGALSASLAIFDPVPVGKSDTNVVMVQAAEDGPRFDAAEGLNWSPHRRILV